VESTLTTLDTVRTEHTVRLICATYVHSRRSKGKNQVQTYTFRDAYDFWETVDHLAEVNHPLYLVAHNLNYDLGVLAWDVALTDRDWELKRMYNKGTTTIIRMSREKRTLIFVDNMNWFKCSLAVLGDLVGLPKLDVDPLNATDEEIARYCPRDVEIMVRAWELWFKFLDDNDMGNWAVTAPSQAMHAFRHRFLHHKLLVHRNTEAIEMEREAYRGGRTSVFYRGELHNRPVFKLDLNSAYPAAMLAYPMPTRLMFVSHHVDLADLSAWIKAHCVIAEVEVNCDRNPFPVHHHGHNVYPVGVFTTTLTTPELSYALGKGWITRIMRAAVYEAHPIFAKYIAELYAIRQGFVSDGNIVYAYLMKLMLNGLYGKFGQTASEFVEYGPVDEVLDRSITLLDPAKCTKEILYRFGQTLYTEEDQGETPSSMPAIAAHVTAYVRMRLFTLREKAGTQEVYYCDTDSLFVSTLGRERLDPEIDPTRLGALKEEDVTNRLTILSPKTYLWNDHWTRKGVPPSSSEIAPNTFRFVKFPSLRGLARRSQGSGFYTEITTRHLNYTIYDGKPRPDGWIVPLNGSDLTPSQHDDPFVDQRLWEIDTEITALRDTKRLPQSIVLTLWNYRTGQFKQGRDSRGSLVAPEYSNLDSLATELGFADLEALQEAVLYQLSIDTTIRKLTDEKTRLLHLTPPALVNSRLATELPF